jgi:hypothetical protein
MSDPIRVTRPLIDPIYSQSQPSQPIDLGQEVIKFDHRGKSYQGTAKVVMRFVPSDRLEFTCSVEGESALFGHEVLGDPNTDKKLTLADRRVSLDVNCLSAGGEQDVIVFSPKVSPAIVTSPSNAISTSIFHLFNFPAFIGPQDYVLATVEPLRRVLQHCGRIELKAGGWKITIAATDQTGRLTKALDAQGGYVITHMGRVVRGDGSAFSSEQLDELLICLQHFLSFALGRWAGVALPIGFDTADNRVFEQCGMGITADGGWNGSSSWFDAHHAELLSQVFPGFWSLWTNDLWHRPLTHVLYWYLGASDRRVGIGVDSGLILAQTALELLSWTYCVLDRKVVSSSEFKSRRLSAADKLRRLLSLLSIPQQIPAEFLATQDQKWTDGPHAVTYIRNSLVHPDNQHKFRNQTYHKAWALSLWYVDLVLLHLCRHEGEYANRLAARRWKGTVESVPWAQQEADTK